MPHASAGTMQSRLNWKKDLGGMAAFRTRESSRRRVNNESTVRRLATLCRDEALLRFDGNLGTYILWGLFFKYLTWLKLGQAVVFPIFLP